MQVGKLYIRKIPVFKYRLLIFFERVQNSQLSILQIKFYKSFQLSGNDLCLDCNSTLQVTSAVKVPPIFLSVGDFSPKLLKAVKNLTHIHIS